MIRHDPCARLLSIDACSLVRCLDQTSDLERFQAFSLGMTINQSGETLGLLCHCKSEMRSTPRSYLTIQASQLTTWNCGPSHMLNLEGLGST